MSQASAAWPALRLMKIEGEPWLLCGCALFRWTSIAGIGWAEVSGKVLVYFKDASAGNWTTDASKSDMEAFVATIKENV